MEDTVNVLKFVECRAKEIMSLMDDVTSKEPKLNIQRLPYHMRRRAASHNPKRLPRSLQIKKTEETPSKHKKKRKVHKNLLEEYNSRQKPDSVWLPTHIWFAKRFHMKKMWGYQLPFQATGKRFRSSYRATVKNVLVQDLSYFCCIELMGNEAKLLSGLDSLTDDSVGMNFASESFIEGTAEGTCFLYHPNSFPCKAIGPVSFLWKPPLALSEENSAYPINSHRQLWIWCHPSIHNELVEVLVSIFELREVEKTTKEFSFASKTNYMKTKLHFQKEPIYASKDVTMTLLKDTLVRQRILGPNALSVLTSILHPVESSYELCLKMVTSFEDSVQNDDRLNQRTVMINKNEILSSNVLKQYIWYCLRDPEVAYAVPFKTVIGLTIDDPRLYVTAKYESGCKQDKKLENIASEFSKATTAFSALWDKDIRNEVTASQVPEHLLNEERGKYVVSKASDLKKCSSSVPVIVIYQPGANGYGSGWDIIAPQGWGMAFWIPFIYHGAQPAGLDDFCSIQLESGLPTFPGSFPDTKAGYDYEENSRENNLKKFNRYSRAKRPNFKILGVPSPFFMPWNVLVRECEAEFLSRYSDGNTCARSSDEEDKGFFVMRDKKEIINLRNLYELLISSLKKKAANFQELFSDKIQSLLTTEKGALKALLLVRVECLHRGTPSNCSGVYLPNQSDFEMLKENPKYLGPVEPKHKLETDSLPPNKRRKLLKEEARQARKVLDRPMVDSVFSFSEHKPIGFLSEGGYSRLGGHSYGIGHVTLAGFLMLLQQCERFEVTPFVLTREQHTFQYRPARIDIIITPF